MRRDVLLCDLCASTLTSPLAVPKAAHQLKGEVLGTKCLSHVITTHAYSTTTMTLVCFHGSKRGRGTRIVAWWASLAGNVAIVISPSLDLEVCQNSVYSQQQYNTFFFAFYDKVVYNNKYVSEFKVIEMYPNLLCRSL